MNEPSSIQQDEPKLCFAKVSPDQTGKFHPALYRDRDEALLAVARAAEGLGRSGGERVSVACCDFEAARPQLEVAEFTYAGLIEGTEKPTWVKGLHPLPNWDAFFAARVGGASYIITSSSQLVRAVSAQRESLRAELAELEAEYAGLLPDAEPSNRYALSAETAADQVPSL